MIMKKTFTLAEGRLAWQTQSALTQTDVNRHKSTGTNSCNHLITQSLSHLITSKAAAFTLAEVLITQHGLRQKTSGKRNSQKQFAA